ncbi:MAG: prephenate dehydrogenase [candidate division KSB1 bacterium]|nr:prephenate dehydrogenase [candidate division KSB1 bacterium]
MSTCDHFKTISIIGVGLIGGSLGLALRRKKFRGRVIGIDDPYVLENALKRGAIDEGISRINIKDGLEHSDLVFLCTPITDIMQLLKEIGDYVKSGTLITDVGSIKRQIVETANLHLPSSCSFIGGHPMAGSEFRGVHAADPFLFENTSYVLTPSRPVDVSKRQALGELLECIGAKVLLLQPKLHDEIAGAVSHLPQMAAIALMNLVAKKQTESPHFLKMAAGGFRDMTRIASSPFGIWEDICDTNADMITGFIDAYVKELEELKGIINNKGKLESYFHDAAKNRLSIPTDTKGFLNPQYEISVSVEDRPGIIADIAGTLAKESINIKDIEVLKIREDEGGTIRLAFAGESEQTSAIELLQKHGFECRKRG